MCIKFCTNFSCTMQILPGGAGICFIQILPIFYLNENGHLLDVKCLFLRMNICATVQAYNFSIMVRDQTYHILLVFL